MYTGTFGPASNRADYRETIRLRASDDDPVPTVDEIEIVIGEKSRCATLKMLLSAEQITYDPDIGEFTFTLSSDELRRFPAGSHDMGMVVTIEGFREQLFVGDLVIVEGIVS